MKRSEGKAGVLVALFAAGLIGTLPAQSLTPVSPVPEAGTFWSLQRGDNFPALPFVPDLLVPVPVFSLGEGHYVYDDGDIDYEALAVWQQALRFTESGPPEPGEGGGEGGGSGYTNQLVITNLWLEVTATGAGRDITVTITNVPGNGFYDLFRTFGLVGDHVTHAVWRWIARGTNGQSFTFSNVRCPHAFYVLGYDVDTDGDTLTDAFELLTSKTSPMTNHTYSVEWDDREWWLRSNVLVNDPEQDCGNEQNSQFETTIAVVGSNVVVACGFQSGGVCLGTEPQRLPHQLHATPGGLWGLAGWRCDI